MIKKTILIAIAALFLSECSKTDGRTYQTYSDSERRDSFNRLTSVLTAPGGFTNMARTASRWDNENRKR